ncbi:MAG: TonB-dependent receptor [bacterium]|nr:TonB-dependent receptor [bacterium]
MKPIKHLAYVIVIFATFYFGFLHPVGAADKTCDPWVAKAVSIQGIVEARKSGQTRWVQIKSNDTFCNGDMIRVQENSRAAVVLSNESNLSLDQKTTITFTGIDQKKSFLLDLLSGAVHFFSRFPRSIEVLTPFLNASVEGTEGFIKVKEEEVFLSIFEGKVLASNAAGSLMLGGGQSAAARAGKAPVLRVVVRPRDAVHWALYYLPVIYVPLAEAPNENLSDPRFLAYRASRFLAVGRVEKADIDIKRALRLDPKYSDAFALQAIIAVVHNEKDKALTAAQKAVETGPDSATARIALSYARQAGFDLEGARASVEEAVKLDPNNALAYARLAELWSSSGRLDKAIDAAKKAVALDPSLARTQMVLGFAYLAQVKTKKSKTAFEKAIKLDQADPLSRLGLGLAKIRDGNLKAGGRDIEIAASLDPNNSLVRSYLGKTYFEEKRTDLDGREYAIAKELDPNDPTPFFYDAIRKQTTNRPVEALRDYQKAIELNDNRAVYRSKLLLDSDLAARSAAIARIYSNLGFQQRALLEGWSSLNSDPTNFSAHRFLADSYSVLPRREIARVSELLQSQLLQPINITPIQPRLAESNLFLIAAQGPGSTSFNEFNPLFNRNRVAVQGSGLLAENDTLGGEGIVSGIYNRFSFSGGYSYFDTDGWYDNADQTDRIANVYTQYEFTPKTSIQAEYRYRDTEKGDVLLRYWEDNRSPFLRQEDKTNRIRLGLRHAFSPSSTLLGNFQYSDADGDASDLFSVDSAFFGLPPPAIQNFSDSDRDESAYSGELSYLFRSRHVDIASGAGYFYIDQKITSTNRPIWPGPPPIDFGTFPSKLDQDIDHYNIYLYSYIRPIEKLMLTVGASGDFYDADDKDDARDLDRNKFNPKFGVAWYPFDGTTVRGAIFRTFKRTLSTDQTLEPTQVAGFNQFFDEANATEAWVYGAGVDQKLSQNTYAGAEFFYRDLSVPVFTGSGTPGELAVKNFDWDEYLGRAYLYYTPHEWLALRAEYGYEKFDYTDQFNPGAEEIKTHRVPLGVNFFHPSGISAGLTATYYYQKGDFENFKTTTISNADNTFWLVDAALGYRLPKRYGVITAGVTNLFDNDDFEYWEVDLQNSRIQPDRQAFIKVTLALP